MQTRRARINPKLEASGWKVVRSDPDRSLSGYPNSAIEEYETDNGPAGYALCSNAVLLGIVEAKKLTLGPQNVLTQAERYSRRQTAGASRTALPRHDPTLARKRAAGCDRKGLVG